MKMKGTAFIAGGLILAMIMLIVFLLPTAPAVSSGPKHFFEETPNPGPKVPRGGDIWQNRSELVK
jgi:hypothetical protein